MNQGRHNRMESNGPNRKSIKELLHEDRQATSRAFMTCCLNVLEKEYGWNKSEVVKFSEKLLEEVKRI